MRPETLVNFERFLRMFCRERGLELEERSGKGPHRTYVIYKSAGERRWKVGTIVLRGDRKEIPPAVVRIIIDAFNKQLNNMSAHETAEEVPGILRQLIETLRRWLQQ